MDYINEGRAPVIAFFNGEDLDLDSKNDVLEHFLHWGVEDEELYEIIGEDLLDDHIREFIENEYPMYFPFEDRTISELKSFRRSYLCGGGRHECLEEIKLLMDALNFRYKLYRKFIYGD